MHQVALIRPFRAGKLGLAGILCLSVLLVLPLQAQQIFGEQPPPDLTLEADPQPQVTPPLFVPVKPGLVEPTPDLAPVPVATPILFVPSDIPPPAIQATGETLDLIPEAIPTPYPTPVPIAPTPTSVSAPIPVRVTPASRLTQPVPSTQPVLIVQPAVQQVVPSQTIVSTRPAPTPAPPRKKSAPAPAANAMSQNQINSMVSRATDKRDAKLATQIGWAYYNRNEFSSAGIWFNQALEWNSQLGDAAYGLALSKFREGDLSSAEAIANYRAGSYPKLKTLQGDIYSRRGTEAYESRNYAQSLEYFNNASKSRALSRNERVIVAWSLYYTKQYEESAKQFEKLYRASGDEISAQGLYASLTKLRDYNRLDALANQLGGPLKKVYLTYDARRYYEAHLFNASADAGGTRIYPILENINTPSVAGGFRYHTKSGSAGEGQLQAVSVPIQAQFFPANKFILSGYLSYLNLTSKSLPQGAQFGNVPETFTPFSHKANTTENALWEVAVRLEYQDWISWYITLGATPLNGPLQSWPVGNAGLIWRDARGYVQGELYSKSIKESITSWVGSVDPYTGQTWGRVTETGINLSVFRGLPGDNTIFLKGGIGSINGTNVEDNVHIYGTIAVAHVWRPPGYEYVTLGVSLSGEGFENNQNHFTYGNGGYFSPEYLVQGLVQAQFLTEEAKNWIVAGSAGAGVQNNKQAASPFFPLDDDGREFGAQESTTPIGLVQVQGAYLINPNWMIGASFSFAVTADYNEGSANIWLRYFFEQRKGLFRTDLLGFDNY